MGVTGLKIHRITRVHNRILKMRFDEKLDSLLDSADASDLTKYVQLNFKFCLVVSFVFAKSRTQIF